MANRTESEQFDISKLHKDCVDILRAKQWLVFLENFNGHNELTTREFASSFIGERAKVGNLSFRVSKDIISHAIGISPEGEKYFKTKQCKEKPWTHFVSKSRVSAVNWKTGVPRSWLIHPWDEIVYVIQNFIACEGIYNIMYIYHIKLLMHLRGDCVISLPYFLLQSLTKMSKTIQKWRSNMDRILYHFGLVKILIEFELQKIGLS